LLEGDLPAQRHHAAEGHLLRANWQIRAILFFSALGANRLRSQMHTEPLPSPIGDKSSQDTPAQAQEVNSLHPYVRWWAGGCVGEPCGMGCRRTPLSKAFSDHYAIWPSGVLFLSNSQSACSRDKAKQSGDRRISTRILRSWPTKTPFSKRRWTTSRKPDSALGRLRAFCARRG
jgi:hypothetical protein